jgi:peptidoglycan hydrolase-like protein with peptidoglycan-binding domain
MTRTAAAAVALVLVGAAGATAWWLTTPRHPRHAEAAVPVATATVIRTTLVTTTQLSGTIGYGGPSHVIAQLDGTITALPPPGQVVRRGQRLYEVDGVGIFLFYGRRPAWRSFAAGMSDGRDVRQLQRNLVALGLGSGLTVNGTFNWTTEQAVLDWQQATGQPRTGRLELGRIDFAAGPLRVQSDDVSLGTPAGPGTAVMTATAPRPVVTVAIPATQGYLVHRGDPVTVTVPSGRTSPGHVVAISTVATTPQSDAQSNGPAVPSVPARVALDHPAVAAHLDQAPVTVDVVDRRARDVLAVPVTALVALAGGGYAVWIDTATGRHLVAVRTGLFADTRVQVSAPGLRAGDRVEVAAQ